MESMCWRHSRARDTDAPKSACSVQAHAQTPSTPGCARRHANAHVVERYFSVLESTWSPWKIVCKKNGNRQDAPPWPHVGTPVGVSESARCLLPS